MVRDWHKGWMNTVLVCPNKCGVLRTYLAPNFQLEGICIDCGSEMEGVRVMDKELA